MPGKELAPGKRGCVWAGQVRAAQTGRLLEGRRTTKSSPVAEGREHPFLRAVTVAGTVTE